MIDQVRNKYISGTFCSEERLLQTHHIQPDALRLPRSQLQRCDLKDSSEGAPASTSARLPASCDVSFGISKSVLQMKFESERQQAVLPQKSLRKWEMSSGVGVEERMAKPAVPA